MYQRQQCERCQSYTSSYQQQFWATAQARVKKQQHAHVQCVEYIYIYRSNRAIEQKHQKGTDRREEEKKNTSENRAEGRFREPNNRSCYTQYVYLFIGFTSDADARSWPTYINTQTESSGSFSVRGSWDSHKMSQILTTRHTTDTTWSAPLEN